MTADPVLRGDTYYLRRRVPKRFKPIEDRALIWVSLHTDSLREARIRADSVWAKMIGAWEALLAGEIAAADEQMEAARRIAKVHGFRYRPVDEIAKGPLEDLLARIEAATTRDGKLDPQLFPALLGSIAPPKITILRALDIFFDLSKDRIMDMTRNQERVWRNARTRAFGLLIGAVGPKKAYCILAMPR